RAAGRSAGRGRAFRAGADPCRAQADLRRLQCGGAGYRSADRRCAAGDVLALNELGLAVRALEGPVGAASALKMSYAGITKGLTAVGSAMMLGADRAGAAQALKRELAESQPHLLAYLTKHVPAMFPKAYRWVAEMEEIAQFLAADPAAPQVYAAMARLYARFAESADTPETGERAVLARFCREAR